MRSKGCEKLEYHNRNKDYRGRIKTDNMRKTDTVTIYCKKEGMTEAIIKTFNSTMNRLAKVSDINNPESVKQAITKMNVNMDKTFFLELSEDYIVKVASTVEEACQLFQFGFKLATEIEGRQIFRKRK